MDDSRKYDLVELTQRYENARSEAEKDHFERLIRRIYRETHEVRVWRERLIKAIRAPQRDKRRIRYIQEELRALDKQRTGGRESLKLDL